MVNVGCRSGTEEYSMGNGGTRHGKSSFHSNLLIAHAKLKILNHL